MTSQDLEDSISHERMEQLKKVRKFGGKSYRIVGVYTESQAKSMVKKIRGKGGYLARMVKLPLTRMQGGWTRRFAIYARAPGAK